MLLAFGLVDLGRMARTAVGMRGFHRSRERLTGSDWGWYVLYPVASTLVLTGTGVALARGWPFPVHVLAAGLLGHMVVGVHNAWELADWLATRQ